MLELRAATLDALRIADPATKVAAVAALTPGHTIVDTSRNFADPGDVPGRPARPILVRPGAVAQRSVATPEGRAALVHALTHIEFNTINLALDIT